MHALIIDDQVALWPYSPAALRRDHPQVSFPAEIPSETLAEFGVVEVSPVAPPTFDPLRERVAELLPTQTEAGWTQAWAVETLDAAAQAEAAERLRREYDDALTAHIDGVARARGYADRISCAARAGYVGPYQVEGAAFGAWMDSCNAQAYEVLELVLAGERPLPTIDEMLAELPVMVWPESAW
jgi:hypothetical protein